jgi:(1->4)-alpha-D-glucan 1-alpha-D-glucosylmutase
MSPRTDRPWESHSRNAEWLRDRRRVPVSTYRLQFHAGFTFRDAAALVHYLARLGVTDVYSSPTLRASPGSRHGYDICDHNELNPEIGSEADYRAFTDALAASGMGQLLDFVPNHMGTDPAANRWWKDVLENGPCSPHARFFDIDWRPVKEELRDKVLLPVLGAQYGEVLEKGELKLEFRDGALLLRYFDWTFPVNPRESPLVYRQNLDALRAALPPDDPDLREFLSVLTQLENLPRYVERDPARIEVRQREKEVARARLNRLADPSPAVREHLERNVALANGEAGKPQSFDLLHELLEHQVYRLSYWRTAGHEINYRRFFDINALAGLRMEDEKVFAETHALVLRLIREGMVHGLRLDHVDGLYDPADYFDRLQGAVFNQWRAQYAEVALAQARKDADRPGGEPAAGGHLGRSTSPPFYVLVEKILSPGETLPDGWAVHGTSGYEFAALVNGLFVDPSSAAALRTFYGRFTGRRAPFSIVGYVGKRLIMTTSMPSELNVLARALNRLSEKDRRTRDFTLESLRDALREVVACFPVYRTYLAADGPSASDRLMVEIAISRARRRNPATEPSIFEFVRSAVLPEPGADPEFLRFAMRFQQYTGPVQAKGLEDTAFYRYGVLISLNEVGGNPDKFGHSPAEFHSANAERLAKRPYSLMATATHDTKRGEDARVRIDAISETASEWRYAVLAWRKMNEAHKTWLEGEPAPDMNDEYRFYQTLVGVWPAGDEGRAASSALVERVRAATLKAVKEAKLNSSWINANQAYEEGVLKFVDACLAGAGAARFLPSFLGFLDRAAPIGMVNGLAQAALKIGSPGVPDFYQGTELWDHSLVDPDNRRPVDFAVRARMLAELEPIFTAPAGERRRALAELLENWTDGRAKLFLTACGLRRRREDPELFLEGAYVPLASEGKHAEKVVAFARTRGDRAFLVAGGNGAGPAGRIAPAVGERLDRRSRPAGPRRGPLAAAAGRGVQRFPRGLFGVVRGRRPRGRVRAPRGRAGRLTAGRK